jgi:hypothetical protein
LTSPAARSRPRSTPWRSPDRIVCVFPLSKDLKGELDLVESEPESCRRLRCKTLETLHHLKLEVLRHDCDSDVAAALDGTLSSGDLVHKFADADGNNRGVHEGTFRWSGSGAKATGTLKGITNAGTHRPPAFKECQRCDDRGVMEGLLVGTIRSARDRRLVGCTIQAAYRLRFDPGTDGGRGGVQGTLEGAIVCDCGGPERICVELATTTAGPNPLTAGGVSFAVDPLADPTVLTTFGSSFTGLDVRRATEISLPPSSSVELTLVTLAQAATMEAFNSDGSSAGTASMSGTQNVAESFTLTGASIDRVVVKAPADETLLLRLCYTPPAR